MKSDFKRMKERSESGQDFRRIFNVVSYGEQFLKGSKYVNRIRKAIDGNPAFNHMFVCDGGKGRACFSVFCMSCRRVKQDRMYENYTSHFADKYDDDEPLIRNNARFGTVLHSLVPVNVETEDLENETVAAVEDAVAELKKRLLGIDRKAKRLFGKDIWLNGGVHLELVDYDRWQFAALSGSRTHKQKTYSEFIERSSNNAEGHYFLVHTHFLSDLDGMQDADFGELFREQWNTTSRQVLIKRLTDTYETGMGDVKHELDKAYRNIANYCYTGSNHGLAYAKNWGNSGKVIETGERVDIKGNVKTFAKEIMSVEIEDALSLGHLRLLIQVHNALTDGNAQGLRVQVR
jgi:hypothetical protein